MEHEETLDANEHYEYLKFVLGILKKTMHHVVAVIGHNFNTNRAICRRVGPTFFGCHIHGYNLAVK